MSETNPLTPPVTAMDYVKAFLIASRTIFTYDDDLLAVAQRRLTIPPPPEVQADGGLHTGVFVSEISVGLTQIIVQRESPATIAEQKIRRELDEQAAAAAAGDKRQFGPGITISLPLPALALAERVAVLHFRQLLLATDAEVGEYVVPDALPPIFSPDGTSTLMVMRCEATLVSLRLPPEPPQDITTGRVRYTEERREFRRMPVFSPELDFGWQRVA